MPVAFGNSTPEQVKCYAKRQALAAECKKYHAEPLQVSARDDRRQQEENRRYDNIEPAALLSADRATQPHIREYAAVSQGAAR